MPAGGRDRGEVSVDVRGGDPTAVFATLFEAHARGLHRYLARRVGQVADDLLAETFVEALRSREQFDPGREPRAWLYGIATNLLHRHYRQEQRRFEATARDAATRELSPPDNPGEITVGHIDAQRRVNRLAAAIAGLAPADRDVLLLTAWAGLDSGEIAAALGIPTGTVRSRLHRIRRDLRTHESALNAAATPSSENEVPS